MVKINSFPSYYNVLFKKEINGIPSGTVKEMMIIHMIGRVYQHGKDSEGHFIDTTGTKDNRVMVMGAFDYLKKIMDEFYCVLSDVNEVNDCFDEVPRAIPIDDIAPSM